MKHIRLEPVINGKDIKRVQERYHFQDADVQMLHRVYETLCPLLHAEGWYGAGPDGEACNCIVTLGPYVDELEELYERAGAMSEAYSLECIAMELLQRSYEALSDAIRKEYGKGIAGYEFFGEKRSFEEMAEVLRVSGQQTVRCNQAGMLQPKKSVIFVARLAEDKACRVQNICAECSNLFCRSRQRRKESGAESS